MAPQKMATRATMLTLGAAMLCGASLVTPVHAARADTPPPTEMLVYDWNKPVTTKERGFPRYRPPMLNTAWPAGFSDGTYYLRLELKSMPVPQIMNMQYCLWQDNFALESCTRALKLYGTPNTVASWSQPLAKMWMKNGVPIDYSRPRLTDGFAISDKAMRAVSDFATWNWHGNNPAAWYPMQVRLMVVAVQAGATFSGWGNYSALPVNFVTNTYEAENAKRGSAVVGNQGVGFSGSGYVDYAAVYGSWIDFPVNDDTYGDGKFTLRYANGSTKTLPIKIMVNGKLAVKFTCPPTGGWSNWTEVTFSNILTRGANSVKAVATSSRGGPNIDYIKVETEAAPITP